MKKLYVWLAVFALWVLFWGTMSKAHAQYNWQDNPYNWKNSEYNWQNSPNNYENSPYNPKNSQYNYNAPNGVYDNNGNRVGYVVTTPQGTKNYFDNNGERIGYGRVK
jgi:hypothetical protein